MDIVEAQRGFDALRRITGANNIEIIEESRPWSNRTATYFVFGRAGKTTDVVLSDEFLGDLPAAKEYKQAAEKYFLALSKRIQGGDPNQFCCVKGVAFRCEIRWPTEFDGLRDAIWLRVNAYDLTGSGVAKCAIRFPGRMPTNIPFEEVRIASNLVRAGLDSGNVVFYPENEHPDKLQVLDAGSSAGLKLNLSPPEIEQYLTAKAYLLGFKAVEAPSAIWIADPWDADYLGVSLRELRQSAHLLALNGEIRLEGEFAIPMAQLLNRYRAGPAPTGVTPTVVQPDFSFMDNTELKNIVERDYAELITLEPARTPKSVLIMAGAVLEGVLLDALLVSRKREYQDFLRASTKSLSDMIGPAKAEGIIKEDRLTEAIRKYRALAHPGREVREKVVFTADDAALAKSAVEVTVRDVRQWHERRSK